MHCESVPRDAVESGRQTTRRGVSHPSVGARDGGAANDPAEATV